MLPTISLYTGMGGLDLGLELTGFEPAICVEMDKDARRTLTQNRPHWRQLDDGDVHRQTPDEIVAAAGLTEHEAALVVGGPPCQPFSKAGWWSEGASRRLSDPRALTLTAYLDVVEAALPAAFVLENVPGFAYKGMDDAVQLLRSRLADVRRRREVEYQLSIVHVNAADYGVAQSRRRLFAIGIIDGEFQLPPATHGPGAREPSRTAWDAIGDLDGLKHDSALAATGKWADLLPSIPEGWNYQWHTNRGGGLPLFGWRTRYWSFLLKLAKALPSWTLQAESGPATGPFHWSNRLLSARELSRLQTIPDDIKVTGNRRAVQRQLGNAVPTAVGELLGRELARIMAGALFDEPLTSIPPVRDGRPRRSPIRPVSSCYEHLIADHTAHRGVGLGPGAARRKQPPQPPGGAPIAP